MSLAQKHFAVVGHPVAHSLSPWIHQQFAAQTGIALHYGKMDVLPEQFEHAIKQFFAQNGAGLNITLPFKENAFVLADNASQRCQQARAANTLWMHKGQLHADNTDGFGLITDVSRFVELSDKNVLILGAGGAVRGILAELKLAAPATLTIMNRTFARAKALQTDYPFLNCIPWGNTPAAFDVIINGTSAAMLAEELQLPAGIAHAHTFCYDLAYKQKGNTAFVNWAEQQNLQAADGMGMLVFQAAEAFFLWHGVRPDAKAVLEMLLA